MMSRWLTILLIVSLVVNGFLAGAIAIGGLHGFGHRGMMVRAHMDRGAGMFRDTHVLSEEGREAFHAVFRKSRDDLRPSFRETRRLRDELGAALAADPWDRPRVEQAFAALRDAEAAHQAAFSTTLIDAFERLSAADRRALVEAAHSRREEWRERRRHRREHRRENEPAMEALPPSDAPDEGAPPPPD
jgi:uncharacterized membrane protein